MEEEKEERDIPRLVEGPLSGQKRIRGRQRGIHYRGPPDISPSAQPCSRPVCKSKRGGGAERGREGKRKEKQEKRSGRRRHTFSF